MKGFTGKGFTGIKDLDLKILMELDDKDLIQACVTNKELYRICNVDQPFWRNRFIKQYGEKAAEYKPDGRSWKNHYLQVYIDLHRFPKPVLFLGYIAWKNNVSESYFVDWDNFSLVRLKSAPEWVLTNLYLLKLPDIFIIGNEQIHKGTTPFEALRKYYSFQEERYLLFIPVPGLGMVPNYTSLEFIKAELERLKNI